MKKLFFIFVALCLVFCGCEDADRDIREGQFKYERDFDDFDGGKDDPDDDFDFDDKYDRGDIQDDYFEALGRTPDEVERVYGKKVQSEWVDGPVYKFERSDSWYAFSEYKTEGDNYIPDGRCNVIMLDVSDFVETKEPEIDASLIASLSDTGISKGFDEMEGLMYFEITHDEYKITIYEDQNGELSGDSAAYVRFIGE